MAEYPALPGLKPRTWAGWAQVGEVGGSEQPKLYHPMQWWWCGGRGSTATLTLNNTGTQVGSVREGTEQSTMENISFNLKVQKVPATQKEKFALSFGRSLEEAAGLFIAYPPVSPEPYPVLRSGRNMPSPLEDKQKKIEGPSKFRKSEVSVAASKAGWLATAPGRKSHTMTATVTFPRTSRPCCSSSV